MTNRPIGASSTRSSNLGTSNSSLKRSTSSVASLTPLRVLFSFAAPLLHLNELRTHVCFFLTTSSNQIDREAVMSLAECLPLYPAPKGTAHQVHP
jgi:hypothetical protein